MGLVPVAIVATSREAPQAKEGTMPASAWMTISAYALACMALLFSEVRHWRAGRMIFKTLASTAFVLLALQLDAAASAYGRAILLALGLSWLGDVLLLSTRSRIFLIGIASFLLAHLAFSWAFVLHGFDGRAAIGALVVMAAFGIAILAWLRPHLSGLYRFAVPAYVLAIVMMVSLSVAASVATGTWSLAAGAVLFAVSDISVARDRFVSPGYVNRLWGLPLYYLAQIVLVSTLGLHATN